MLWLPPGEYAVMANVPGYGMGHFHVTVPRDGTPVPCPITVRRGAWLDFRRRTPLPAVAR